VNDSPVHSLEALNARDKIRDLLMLEGAQPYAVRLGETTDGQPEFTFRLSLKLAQLVADRLERIEVRSMPVTGMVLWSTKLCQLGRVESVQNEWIALHPLYGDGKWRCHIEVLRPPLLAELEEAQRKAGFEGMRD
jgi:hypothetical protein